MRYIRRFDPTITRRPASYRGPRSSFDFTSCIDEIIRDLTEISTQWNTGIQNLLTTLPDGSDDADVDAFVDGIDGRTVYVDSSLTTNSSVLTFWHSVMERPRTVKEALEDLYTYADAINNAIRSDLSGGSGALTTDQKSRIGMNIFDSSQTSSPTSLDGKSETNRLNVVQLAKDLYGTGYSLGGDGLTDLTYSVYQMVDALLEAHGGNWSDDITLVHSGITLPQTSVSQSATVNDSFAGLTGDLQDDLNQVRTRIKGVAGTATWTTALPALYAGGADSLKDLLDSTYASGVKATDNPWGYRYDNIDGLLNVFDAIKAFTGQEFYEDFTAEYSSNHFVTNNNDLQSEIGVIDSVLNWVSDPTVWRNSQHCRRLESPLTGSGLTVTHNKGSHPHVQVVQIAPSPLVSGMLPYVVTHNSLNEFELRMVDRNDGVSPSGVVGSGICVSLW